jgi:hypothetical protein
MCWSASWAKPFAAYGTRAYVEAHPSSRTDARWQDCAWVGFDATHRYFLTARWLTARRGTDPTYRCPNGFVLVDVLRGGRVSRCYHAG